MSRYTECTKSNTKLNKNEKPAILTRGVNYL